MAPNRLSRELSPYLLKHAHNPVDWYPWGEEAFEAALQRDCPVFLSIGYATCHWCNVMEAESFTDPEVAAILNDYFVPIKVDREERPDIDSHYMSVCRLVSEGGGGWPLTAVLMPDRRAFFAGTYFPKNTEGNRIGLVELLTRLRTIWKREREMVESSAERIVEALREEQAAEVAHEPLGLGELAQAAASGLRSLYDPDNGGFGLSPKFPSPHLLLFLMDHASRTGQTGDMQIVTHTLRRMRRGGLFDQLGYGFHRYSTDGHWGVPHFEKMLYDQALMVLAYIEAHVATGEPEFARVAEETITYVLEDLASPEGGFYTARGADSEGREGAYYVWRVDQVEAALAAQCGDALDHKWVSGALGITEAGNFVDRHHPGEGESVPSLQPEAPLPEGDLLEALRAMKESRAEREAPELDDKVLADLNGLMIAALARAGAVLGVGSYLRAAEAAAEFVLSDMRDARQGRLLHRYRAGQASLPAMAEDYAFMTWGLLGLHEATGEARWLEEAVCLSREFIRGFEDTVAGGFYLSPEEAARELPVRPKETSEGAVPSANSVMVHNLARLSRLTGLPEFTQAAERTVEGLRARASANPSAHAHFIAGALRLGETG